MNISCLLYSCQHVKITHIGFRENLFLFFRDALWMLGKQLLHLTRGCLSFFSFVLYVLVYVLLCRNLFKRLFSKLYVVVLLGNKQWALVCSFHQNSRCNYLHACSVPIGVLCWVVFSWNQMDCSTFSDLFCFVGTSLLNSLIFLYTYIFTALNFVTKWLLLSYYTKLRLLNLTAIFIVVSQYNDQHSLVWWTTECDGWGVVYLLPGHFPFRSRKWGRTQWTNGQWLWGRWWMRGGDMKVYVSPVEVKGVWRGPEGVGGPFIGGWSMKGHLGTRCSEVDAHDVR